MSDLGNPSYGFGPLGPGAEERREMIELVGPHLRVYGCVSLLRFLRLSDLINHNRGFLRLEDAGLLRRNGEATGLTVPELMVNPDEITFIGQTTEDINSTESSPPGGLDRPQMERTPRELVLFTEGHILTGTVYLFAETDVAIFVDSPDPRFVALVNGTARSLADRRVISRFALMLVNRTQITAASLLETAGPAAESGVSVD